MDKKKIEAKLGRPLTSPEVTFIEEVEKVGLEVEVYHGYAFRVSPAVRVWGDRELVDVIRATTPGVRWDGIGSDSYMVYPG